MVLVYTLCIIQYLLKFILKLTPENFSFMITVSPFISTTRIGGNVKMYAIIQTGGKQYRVEKGDIIEVELLSQDQGAVEFKKVLLYSNGEAVKIGTPHLNKFFVRGEILGEIKASKVIAFKYKRRKNYRRKVGHRQKYSRVKIIDIVTA